MSESTSPNPQLRDVLPGEELPVERLRDFLRRQDLIASSAAELRIRQFSAGFSNLTYLVEVGDRRFVLRRPPFGAVKRGHDMGREYRVLSHLRPVFDKVPRTYAYTEDESIIGAPFYLMERIEGIILNGKEARRRQIPPADFRTIADTWLSTFVELHQIDYAAAGLAELGRPAGYVERQVTNWSKQYRQAKTDEIPTADKVMQWMLDHQPREYDHALIHNDYKYDNVVFADDSWTELRAVLDWEMCTLGDPLMDLGTSLGYWVTDRDPQIMRQVAQSPTAQPGNPSRSEIVEAYAQRTGRPIRHLTFYYVYGLFKIAVIVQQIYYRYRKGLTQDPRFARLNQFTALLCDTAWRAAQTDRID